MAKNTETTIFRSRKRAQEFVNMKNARAKTFRWTIRTSASGDCFYAVKTRKYWPRKP